MVGILVRQAHPAATPGLQVPQVLPWKGGCGNFLPLVHAIQSVQLGSQLHTNNSRGVGCAGQVYGGWIWSREFLSQRY
jgi:hypothetical protein